MLELDSLNCALDKLTLVEAAAGTGKTHNIQNIVVRLLVERELPVLMRKLSRSTRSGSMTRSWIRSRPG